MYFSRAVSKKIIDFSSITMQVSTAFQLSPHGFFSFFFRSTLDKIACLVYSIAVCFIFIGNPAVRCVNRIQRIDRRCPAKNRVLGYIPDIR